MSPQAITAIQTPFLAMKMSEKDTPDFQFPNGFTINCMKTCLRYCYLTKSYLDSTTENWYNFFYIPPSVSEKSI